MIAFGALLEAAGAAVAGALSGPSATSIVPPDAGAGYMGQIRLHHAERAGVTIARAGRSRTCFIHLFVMVYSRWETCRRGSSAGESFTALARNLQAGPSGRLAACRKTPRPTAFSAAFRKSDCRSNAKI